MLAKKCIDPSLHHHQPQHPPKLVQSTCGQMEGGVPIAWLRPYEGVPLVSTVENFTGAPAPIAPVVPTPLPPEVKYVNLVWHEFMHQNVFPQVSVVVALVVALELKRRRGTRRKGPDP